MHRLVSRFAEMVAEGIIKDMKPIPNLSFSFEELEYLCNNGYMYVDRFNNQFIAVVPESF